MLSFHKFQSICLLLQPITKQHASWLLRQGHVEFRQFLSAHLPPWSFGIAFAEADLVRWRRGRCHAGRPPLWRRGCPGGGRTWRNRTTGRDGGTGSAHQSAGETVIGTSTWKSPRENWRRLFHSSMAAFGGRDGEVVADDALGPGEHVVAGVGRRAVLLVQVRKVDVTAEGEPADDLASAGVGVETPDPAAEERHPPGQAQIDAAGRPKCRFSPNSARRCRRSR